MGYFMSLSNLGLENSQKLTSCVLHLSKLRIVTCLLPEAVPRMSSRGFLQVLGPRIYFHHRIAILNADKARQPSE